LSRDLVGGFGTRQLYDECVRNAALRAFREWLLTAVVAFVIMEIGQQVVPGHRLTLPVIGMSIGAATLGKLSYSAEKAVARRVRSRRAGGVTVR
jgi:hypothetical protein